MWPQYVASHRSASKYKWALKPTLYIGDAIVARQLPPSLCRRIASPFIDLTVLLLNWRFSLPFILNQSASMLFVMLVSRFPVTVVVPCVNALQFVFTAGMGHLIGERIISRRSCIGAVVVLTGVLIMMVSDTLQL
ncbi:unnamed protein product [Heligmosomoides polygyrus]|uniref:EamA domain-containing protein n=1 Tax=Heligmosomoides polygyrus TaxID=6339 RepID=A0A183FQQ3_HELPZ|nr:unnamed protein product [Heligmosomoides polygyrus]